MLPSKAKQTLAANLRLLSGGTDTQAFRERIARKTGGSVSARTIGNMMSSSSGNPTLESIECVAEALGVTAGQLLTEELGRAAGGKAVESHEEAASPRATALLQRLAALEQAGATSPALYELMERALDLVQPQAGKDGYAGLDDLPAE